MHSKTLNKKILVAGAYGLVGSTICRILEYYYPHIQIQKEKCYVLTPTIPMSFDYIIHAAGYGQPQMFGKDKAETIRINTNLTDFLLNYYLKPGGTFLFVSSSEVYSGAPSPHKETDIGTTTPQHPRACYIEGKRCGEAICMAYKEQGYNVKIARLALAYGPGTKKGDTRVLNELIERALHWQVFACMGSGEEKRTYLYVEDAAYLMLDILFKGKETVYNVGGTETVSIKGLGEMIAQITGKQFVVGDPSEKLVGAPSEVNLAMWSTLEEFPREFTPLYEGLKRTIEYQKELYGIN